jgi:hypothetical protein
MAMHGSEVLPKLAKVAGVVLIVQTLSCLLFYSKPTFLTDSGRNNLPFAAHFLCGMVGGLAYFPRFGASFLVALLMGVQGALTGGAVHYLAWRMGVPVDFPGMTGALQGALLTMVFTVPLASVGAAAGFLLALGWRWRKCVD